MKVEGYIDVSMWAYHKKKMVDRLEAARLNRDAVSEAQAAYELLWIRGKDEKATTDNSIKIKTRVVSGI